MSARDDYPKADANSRSDESEFACQVQAMFDEIDQLRRHTDRYERLRERFEPKGTGYMHSRHGGGPLVVVVSCAWHDLWGIANDVAGVEGASEMAIGFVERTGPWLDNMLQLAYEAGLDEAVRRHTSLQLDLMTRPDKGMPPVSLEALERHADNRERKAAQ